VIGAVAPAEGTILTGPAHVTATLTPAAGTTVTGWTVSYRRADDATVTQLASGTGTAVGATVDPTLLPNGSYELVIRATSSDGGATVSETAFVVDGQLKLGRYTTSYDDLDVGVAGLPLRVIRTYDSFDKSVGDFGVGWRVEVANFHVSTNGPLGAGGWRMFGCGGGLIFVPLCFDSSRPHYVTVTWPDGLTEVFDLTPAKGSTFLPGLTAAQFTGRGNTTSKLAALDDGLYFSNGNLLGGFFGSDGIYDPTRFRLTDRFGTVYVLDVDGGLLEMTDRNGNRTTFGPDGITSSFGPGIAFVRDGLGRIKRIEGPDGKAVLYGYDAAGDLVSVTDQNGKVTHFAYRSGHYLESVLDELNRPSSTLEYHPDGRLAAVIDGEGNRIEVASDPAARTETVTDAEHRLTTVSTLDDRGNVRFRNEIFDGRPHVTELRYDGFDNVVYRKDPLGNVWQAAYDGRNLVSFEDPEQQKVEITYENGLPRTWKDQRGRTTEYRWNPEGTLKEIVDASLHAETYTYFANGLRETRTDREGHIWRWTYYPSGLVKTETDPRGNVTRYEYDDAGRVTKTTDDLGGVTTREYDAAGNLRFETDADGNRTERRYDERNRLVREIDPDGFATAYGYDDAGRLTSVDNEADRPTTYTYDRDGHVTAMRVGDLHATTYEYDGGGRLRSVTDPVGRETDYTYYDNGWPRTETNPKGGVTERFYFPDGHLQRVEDPLRHSTSYTYDPTGRLASVMDPVGRRTGYEYSPTGRLTRTIFNDGTYTENEYDRDGRLVHAWDEERDETTYEYDDAGNPTAVTDPEGRRFASTYDDLNRLATETDPLGVQTTYTYTPAGRVQQVATREGVTTTFGYDGRGLETSRRDTLGNTWKTSYDAAGRVDVQTDARGATLDDDYDPYGRLASIADVAGDRVSFGYDDAGQRTSVTDPRLKVWRYTYDELGGLATETDPLAHVRRLDYDLEGRVSSATDARNVAVDVGYFADDRIHTLDERAGPGLIAYGYDEVGRRTSMTDETGTTSWTFWPDGLVRSVAAPAGTVFYAYDRSGRRRTMTQPQGQVGYSYDAAGRLATVTDWSTPAPVTFGYDGDGRVHTISRPNGITTTYAYDPAGRLDRIEHRNAGGIVEFFDYTLDEDGNRTSVTSTAGVERYTINPLDELERVVYPGGRRVDYTYDAAGNRLTEQQAGSPVVPYVYDDASRLTSVGGVAYGHDAAGDLTSAGATTYGWDWRGRLASVGDGAATTSYRYDGDGVRTSVTSGGTTTSLLYDRLGWSGLPELVSDGATAYVHGPDGPLSQVGGGTLYPQTDALGSVQMLTDASGAVAGRRAFDAFGAVAAESGATSLLGFTGAQQDGDLVHLNARDLSTATGRFLSVDPVRPGAPGVTGWNPYAYVGNDPTTLTDPSGLDALVGYGSVLRVAVAATATLALYYWWINSPLYHCLVTSSCFDVFPDGSVGAGTGTGTGTGSLDLDDLIRRIGEKLPALTKQAVEAIAKACAAANLVDLFVDVDTPCSGDLIRLYVPGGLDEPSTSQHISDAIASNASWHRLSRKTPPWPRGWLASQPVCQQAALNGQWCDEYPFASANEGGQANSPSLRGEPPLEQASQGATLGGFYRKLACQPFGQGTPYAVVPVTERFVPTVSICK
jgi:RHS repeat-associated protein